MKRIPPRDVGMSTTDRAFDRLVPKELRYLSKVHWTPIEVAIRASSLLRPTKRTRILDVGSGIGKLCVVGAVSSKGMWCGVEQHEKLVDVSRRLSLALGVAERTKFIHDDAFAVDWRDFDAIYLYNPFEFPLFPNTVDPRQRELDHQVQVARVQDRLASLRARARVITFHGFGGVMPSSYELAYQERIPGLGLDLVLWVQRAGTRAAELA